MAIELPSDRSEPLNAATATRLVEFARACKAAARAVSLYPDGHPTVQSSVTRLVEVARRVTAPGPLRLTVLPANLTVDGRAAEKPDAAVPELAVLLHRHHVGNLVVNDGGDSATWQVFLRLLSRSPEEVRASGGIAHLWGDEGGQTTVQQRITVQIHEIDYEQILLGQGTTEATLDAIINACLLGAGKIQLDETMKAAVRSVIGDQGKLAQLVSRLQAQTSGATPQAQAGALLTLMRGALEAIDPAEPQQVGQAFGNLAVVMGSLSADAMVNLLQQRGTPEATAGSTDLVGTVVGQMPDTTIANFVAGSIIAAGGPSERLAQAFQALVPDFDSRRQLLSLAERKVAESPLGQSEDFSEIWKRTEDMLTSYSDEKYVHEEYARELSRAKTQAVEVEQTADDPPERVGAWLGTVDDAELRSLDLQLLLDVLRIEPDPFRWRDMAAAVVQHVEELARLGDLPAASQLVEAIASACGNAAEIPAGEESRRAFALAALERLAGGRAMRHALSQLRSNEEAVFESVKRLCTVLGPGVVTSLAEVLASEQDARTRRRIRDILLSFGKKGREAVLQLLNAPNWEVRQTAAFLLREFGGTEGLPELERLLTDSEPLVQREAIRALVLVGDERTYGVLARVLAANKSRNRQTLIQQLTSQRDERAIALCAYLVRHIDHRALSDVYLAAIETLGNVGGPDSIAPLRDALFKGDWWAPVRTRALRTAAAQALGRTKLPAATETLREAAVRGSWGVRTVARAQLARLGAQS